jgi:hypothetical protein
MSDKMSATVRCENGLLQSHGACTSNNLDKEFHE